MQITFYRDCYNPAHYGQVTEGDVRDVPDDIAKQLIDRDLAGPWHPLPPISATRLSGPGSVTCIMPTRNRRQFIPRAIACFQTQSYSNRELLILDNGDSIHDLVGNAPNVRYIKLPGGQTIGQLRNICCQLSAGEFIAHWDDDDWYHPERLAEQIAEIGDKAVAGYRSCLFHGEGRTVAYERTIDYAVGSSMLYRRDWWEKNRFKPVMIGEDGDFSERAKEAGMLYTSRGLHRMVASIHAGNTSPRPVVTPPDERQKEPPSWRMADAVELPQEYSPL